MATLPSYVKILREGFSEQRESALLRTEMESGPVKQARVKTRVMVTRSVTLMVTTQTDLLAFESWFENGIDAGAGWFSFRDPVRGTTKDGRFVSGTYTLTQHGNGTAWLIKTQLETWQ